MNKHGGYYGEEKSKVIDFSVNINPLGISKKVSKSLKNNIENIVRYPEIDGDSAKEDIANSLQFSKQNIILGNGAIELIYLFSRALKPKKTLIIQPTFNEYERAFKIVKSNIIYYNTSEKKDFEINIKDLLSKIDNNRPDVVVFCNPNNPTGNFLNSKELKPILDKIKSIDSYLFLDESFIHFTNRLSFIDYVEKYPIFIIRSMTKFYAVPGIRLGYGVGNKNIINKLNNHKEPWAINSLALSIVPEILNDRDYVQKTMSWYNSEKEYMKEELAKIDGIKVYESFTNFFLCKLKDMTSFNLKDRLLKKHNIYIRTCEDFCGLDNLFFRISIRTHVQNKHLIHSLKKALR